MARQVPLPVWGRQGRVRDWFHTKRGARFLNRQTAWFRLYAPKGFGLLTVSGRRSGEPHRYSVRAIVQHRRAVVVSIGGVGTSWFQNITSEPRVRLRIGHRTCSGVARVVRDAEERLEVQRVYVDPVNWFDFVSSFVNQRGIPSATRIRALHTKWFDEGVPLIIELDGSA